MTLHNIPVGAVSVDPFLSRLPRWYLTPEAIAILKDIQDSPPSQRQYLAPLSNIFAGRPETELGYDRNDSRVEALRFMCDAAFRQAEAEGGREGALAFVHNLPNLDRVIDAARSQPSKEGVA